MKGMAMRKKGKKKRWLAKKSEEFLKRKGEV